MFVAIHLPREIQEKLADYQSHWPALPIRWTKKENLHITLVFVGYVEDERLVDIARITKEVGKRHSPFSVRLEKVCYGPVNIIPPRMIWTVGERSEEFAALRDDLEKSLLASPHIDFPREKRGFYPHITMGRMRQWEWRQIEPEERPEIDKELDMQWQVESIAVMESKLKGGGPEYTTIELISLS